MDTDTIQVTSHVARDLLQSAALFQHEHSVVWEYVSNGLEYIEPGQMPVVDVRVNTKAKKITIEDTGRGMTFADLDRYFQMHGENVDRKKGKPGRGMFGTGKSAAFGIADCLRVTTVRNGKRSQVELTRKDIEAETEGKSIPVKVVEKEVASEDANGTKVEIEKIHLKKIDVASVIRHIERHIAHWPNATVLINHKECKVTEPLYSEEHKFSTVGTPFEAKLGSVELVIKIAKAPLEPEFQGIAILSNNVWHTSTLAGCENKPFANYLFGEFDVPNIGKDKSPIPPFDMSRSMRLNPKNELVQQIFAFVGSHLEHLRREIEKRDRERRKQEENKKLQQEADAIADLINHDFNDWREQVKRSAARVPGGEDRLRAAGPDDDEGDDFIFGGDEPAKVVEAEPGPGPVPGPGPGPGPNPENPKPGGPKIVPEAENPDATGQPAKSKQRTRRGGFLVDFKNMGEEEKRAKYEREERTIYVNLDHPQIAAALAFGGIEEPTFRRLAYEVAFAEYAVALASEMAANDYFIDVTEPIFEFRDTLDRLSRAAASIYAA